MQGNVAEKCLLLLKTNTRLQIHPPTFQLFSESVWLVILILQSFYKLKIALIVLCYAKRLGNCLHLIIITEDFSPTEKC